MKTGNSPWTVIGLAGNRTEVCDKDGRLEWVRNMDSRKLQSVIAWSKTQKIVRDAARRRLTKLTKQTSLQTPYEHSGYHI